MPFSSNHGSVSGMINVFAGTWSRRRRADDVSFDVVLPFPPHFFFSFYFGTHMPLASKTVGRA